MVKRAATSWPLKECKGKQGAEDLTRRYTLESHPPAECATMVIGPSVACFAAATAASTLLRYLHRHRSGPTLLASNDYIVGCQIARILNIYIVRPSYCMMYRRSPRS